MRISLLVSVCVLVAAGAPIRAQQPQTGHAAAKFGFEEVSGWLAASADLVPADKYSYKPVATVRSLGELLAHVADGMYWYCGSATAAKDVQWSDAVAKSKAGTGKTVVIPALKKAIAVCAAAHAAPTARIERLMGNVAHSNLHYGNVVTYLRMLGLKPPSS